MKNVSGKLKIILTTLWGIIISLPSKVVGLAISRDVNHMQTFYGVEGPDLVLTQSPEPVSTITNIIRIFPILLGAIVFIVGIVNLVKIKKIDDKTIKQKKIKKTSIIVIISLIIIFLLSLSVGLIKKYAA